MTIFGGFAGPGNPYANDVWVLSGANGLGTPSWKQLLAGGVGAAGTPIGRSGPSCVYDSANNRMIMFGGEANFGGPTDVEQGDVWVLTNASGTGGSPQWIQLQPTGAIPARVGHGAIYDPSSNRMIVYLGGTVTGKFVDVWALTNANGLGGTPTWIQLSASGTPPAGRFVNSIYSSFDPAENRVVLFGGTPGRPTDRVTFNDTWVLTNANGIGGTPTWIQLSPQGALPAPREGASGFYDSATKRLIVFGGTTDPGALPVLGDLWALSNADGNGTPVWQQISTTGTPIPGRSVQESVYDSNQNRMTVFGGQLVAAGAPVNETWVLTTANGISGTQLQINSIAPNHGGNAGIVSGAITGTGFVPGAVVTLNGVGPDILGTNVNVIDSGLLIVSFNFARINAVPGLRSVVVTNPDRSSATLSNGFTVEQGGAPDVWLDIIGRSQIRSGTEQQFYITYGNRGDVDIYDAVLLVSVPKNFSMTVGNLLPSIQPASPVADIGTEFLAPIWVYALPSGSSGVVAINITTPSTTTDDLTISAALLASPTSKFASSGDFADIPRGLDSLAESIVTVLHGPKPLASPTQMATVATTNNLSTSADVCPEELLYTDAQAWQDCENRYQQSTITNIKNVQNLLNPSHSAAGTSLGILGNLQPPIGAGASIFGAILDFFKLKEIADVANGVFASRNALHAFSADPNDKVGSTGAGTSRFISSQTGTSYSIYFDNQPTATAPAQAVTITDTLDSNLGLTTLTLGPITFQNQMITPPSTPLSLAPFTTTIDLRPTNNLLLKVSASLNTSAGVLTWTLQSLDPATGLPPSDPLAGFLPPGAEGSVFFTIMPKSIVTTGTVIQNTAIIVFDVNPPINTPTWSNAIDSTKPVSKVSPMPSTQTSSSFLVQWSGNDDGAGIQDFAIYVSDNGGPFTPFQKNTTVTSATFTGSADHTYGFYSVARDLVGNVEASKTTAEATTQVALITDTTPPVTTAVASPAPNGAGWNNSNVTITLNSADSEAGSTVRFERGSWEHNRRDDFQRRNYSSDVLRHGQRGKSGSAQDTHDSDR